MTSFLIGMELQHVSDYVQSLTSIGSSFVQGINIQIGCLAYNCHSQFIFQAWIR